MNPRAPLHSGSRWRDPAVWTLALAGFALVACFVPPGWTWQRERFEHVVVLDVTQSMNVADQERDGRPVSRLVFAKHALAQAIVDLPCGSRLGWAIFTEYRSYLLFTPVEVCANRAELRSALAAIDGRMAWSGNSEIAKGLHSGIVIAKALPGTPSLVFVTDGHEAPPLEARHRPRYDDKAGELAGLIVGVGGMTPAPIPKTDPLGRAIGIWGADEVAQVDPRTLGRGASVAAEKMIEDDSASAEVARGAEHLSSLREPYLQLLAADSGFAYHRLRDAASLSAALQAAALARPLAVRGDIRPALTALALLLLLVPHALAAWSRRRLR
jgi:mxaL protein